VSTTHAGPASAPPRFRLADRATGLLLHPTSLPGPHGCGDLGPAAREFVHFLAAAGVRWWQMLPIGPTPPDGAPYSSTSAFAGNPLLVSLEQLAADGLLTPQDLASAALPSHDRADYRAALAVRLPRLRVAFRCFVADGGLRSTGFGAFLATEGAWVMPWALYEALRRRHGGRPWPTWRSHRARRALSSLRQDVEFALFVQYAFHTQWAALRSYAAARGVGLLGDIPIFVAHDSCDVWSNPHLFDLHPDGRPRTVSGVPPDLFSRTGQLWGHPQYRWDVHAASGFAWWVARFRRMRALFDAVRIDHFLGFNRVWAVPGGAKTARRGRWVTTPGRALFARLRRVLGPLEVVAEDLGILTPAAAALRDACGFPGMRILQFAFGGDDPGSRYHQPHTYPRACVVYPGTHDNDTAVGWFQSLRAQRRNTPRGVRTAYDRVRAYLGTDGRAIHRDLVRLALASPANLAVIPVQDVLGLDNRARMNRPATTRGNWVWRMRPGALTPAHARWLRELNEVYDRRR